MANYDFFVAGRWRNREAVKQVLELLRKNGQTAYCFIENLYKGEKVSFSMDGDIESIMQNLETLPQDDNHIKSIFDRDMAAEKDADSFLLVLPAGISGHIEAGVAYGMDKPCYAVGQTEKTETLYCVFDEIFPDIKALGDWLGRT